MLEIRREIPGIEIWNKHRYSGSNRKKKGFDRRDRKYQKDSSGEN